jgi:DNA-binding response OmpR family regulator
MTGLRGLRILVVEDETIIAMALEDGLIEAGAFPLVAGSIERAQAVIAENAPFDAAVLDVNLHGRQSYDIARTLREQGVPFVFASGYGHIVIPDDLAHVATITKPYDMASVTAAIDGQRGSGASE